MSNTLELPTIHYRDGDGYPICGAKGEEALRLTKRHGIRCLACIKVLAAKGGER